MATIAREGHYFTVLRNAARNLGDYERVHFRKSAVVPQPSLQSCDQHSGSALISIAPRRPPRSQYVHFNKSTAALFLRQTESFWLQPELTRQSATELLLDRPVGSFLVRGSQRAKYALSLRIQRDEVEDTAVKHFLVQLNQQNFLTIQGSNLPFLSIYDLLAYFCFHQSGGMPCCLAPPDPSTEGLKQEFSESSDSDSDGEPAMPPTIPPRTASMGGGPGRPRLGAVMPATPSQEEVPARKRVGPPKPPRPAQGWGEEGEEGSKVAVRKSSGTDKEQWQLRSPPPSLDTSTRPLPPDPATMQYHERPLPPDPVISQHPPRADVLLPPDPATSQHLSRAEKPRPPDPLPKPDNKSPLMRRRSKSSESFRDSSRRTMAGRSGPGYKPKVSSLIQMFESKSPCSSPTKLRFDRRGSGAARTVEGSGGTGGVEAGQKEEARSSTGVWDSTRIRSGSVGDDAPTPPPKPKVVIPPVPPKPLSSDTTEEGGAPVVPPRTPAPLLPPKPPGSLPPNSNSLRTTYTHRRSRSNESELFMSSLPPQLPPKVHPRFPPGYEKMPSSRPVSEVPTHHTPILSQPEATPTTTTHEERADRDMVQVKGGDGDKDEWVHLERPEASSDPGVSGGEGQRGEEEAGSLGDNIMVGEVDMSTKGGWQIHSSISNDPNEGASKSSKRKSKPLGWAKKKLNFRHGRKKPRKRLRKFILELSSDQSQEFGQKIAEFITDMRSKTAEPHQKMLLEIRNFITLMHEQLLKQYQTELNNNGMEACDNASHVLECTLQEAILQPLSHFVYLRIEEYYATNGHLFQVQRSIHQGRTKSTEEMGIRAHLMVPSEKVISEMTNLFERMMKTSCAISKLEFLLEVVRLTYENIKDSRQPKKTLNDIGADDFLPIFVWVLVQCGFTRAEIEAEYMWGLAHPSLFNGEGGYYLTTLTSAVNVLKVITNPPQAAPAAQQLPTMNNLQTELKVFFEDEHTGQYSSAYYLPILPTMTAAEICEVIAEKRQILDPDMYGLFTVEDGKATLLADQLRPQEIKLKWTLQRTLEQSTGGGALLTLPQTSSLHIN